VIGFQEVSKAFVNQSFDQFSNTAQ